jgi:protein phosphatase
VRIGRVAAASDTGRRRLQNEDAFVCEPPLFAIADGMGGAQAGEVASRIAATAVEELGRDGASVPELIHEANARVWQHSLQDPAVAGMGTTITLAVVDADEGTVEIGHVGDSRAYRIRDGELDQLTPDHTLVAELVRSGRLTQEEADTHPQRSVITRAVGTEPDVDVDAFTVEARHGDLYLLCSDGLTDMLRDDDVLAAVAGAGGEPEQAAAALVRAANDAGGVDNVTVILFELLDDAPEPEEAAAPEPLERTEEDVSAALSPADVARHGAGPGSRAAALTAIGLLALAAILVLWWSFVR